VFREAKLSDVFCPAVAVRSCRLTFTGPSGVRHSVEVTADTPYEAAGLGLNVLRKEGWADQIASGRIAGTTRDG
jgi:hypothetical protein